jgi:hypothetical protein
MERNILLNRLQSNVIAAELDWCVCLQPYLSSLGSSLCTDSVPILNQIIVRAKPLPEHLQSPDIVLAADCIYLEAAFPLLVSTLVALVPPPPDRAPEVLLSYKKRRKADKRFFALLKTHFTWSSLVRDSDKQKKKKNTSVMMRNVRTKIKSTFWQVDDDDDRAQERHSRGAISLLRLFRRPQARDLAAPRG